VSETIIDAELIEETEAREKGRPSVVELPKRAAEAMDAVADTVAYVSADHAQKLRDKAQVVRDIGQTASAAVVAGKQLVGAVSDTRAKLEKLGIKIPKANFEIKNRVGNPRGNPIR
jgi:hypothetical protein